MSKQNQLCKCSGQENLSARILIRILFIVSSLYFIGKQIVIGHWKTWEERDSGLVEYRTMSDEEVFSSLVIVMSVMFSQTRAFLKGNSQWSQRQNTRYQSGPFKLTRVCIILEFTIHMNVGVYFIYKCWIEQKWIPNT